MCFIQLKMIWKHQSSFCIQYNAKFHYTTTLLECSGSNSYISGALLNRSDLRKQGGFELLEGQCDWHQA